MRGKHLSPFCILGWLDNININENAKFDTNIQYGSRVMRIFTGGTIAQQSHIYQKQADLHASDYGMLT